MSIKQLQKLIGSPTTTTTGVVASVSGTIISVATSSGIKIVTNNSGSSIKKNDRVQLDGDSLIAVLAKAETLPVYRI